MLRRSLHSLVLLTAVLGLCGCEAMRNYLPNGFFTFAGRSEHPRDLATTETPSTQGTFEEARLSTKHPSSIVVCRSHQCAPAELSMSTEYIYNSLLQLFDNNNYQKILICQADSQTHVCLENYLSLPIHVGIVPTNAYIDHAKITDVIVGKNSTMNIILNYNVTYGGQVADCTPSKSLLFARKTNHVLLEDAGYTCKMTTVGSTSIKTVFAIDYIDLDYGYIGGYYSIGLSGPAYGGGSGYMLLRLPKNAYPLSPALKAPKSAKRGSLANQVAGMPNSQTDTSSHMQQGVQVFPLEKSN